MIDDASSRPAWIGFWAGPILWFVQQLLLFWLAPLSCHRPWIAPTIACSFCTLIALAAAYSWHHRRPATTAVSSSARRARFVQRMGVIMPLFFLVAGLWQAVATFVYGACLR